MTAYLVTLAAVPFSESIWEGREHLRQPMLFLQADRGEVVSPDAGVAHCSKQPECNIFAVTYMTDSGNSSLAPLYNTAVEGSSQAACLSAANRGRQGSLLNSCDNRWLAFSLRHE